ncbi:PREDICTED: uncharacterized protein LOC108564109 [Nicrophorus vespilloides]|uniref:Uncharacterized protein LOC108564109 n=1 Tax=Nicrophorus vespilloides TaxID=110193 RepID=A0ABM1MVC2_NICVS|nr:PREDICTED: uncharacterized protein LOC108564109 [Nicrophorus vespilloides]
MASYILVRIASIQYKYYYQIIKKEDILSAFLQLGKPVSVRLENGEIISAKYLYKSDKIKSLMIMKNHLEEEHVNQVRHEDMVSIGPNRSLIRSSVLATRKLLMELFPKTTLAGKVCNIFKNMFPNYT